MELTGNRYAGSDWRKLLSTRRGTIVVAAFCTVVAAAILVYAASRYRQSVQSGAGVQTVLVANGTILKGTPGDVIASQQLFHTQSIAAGQVSAGAIADTALLHGKVAVADISPGQQLTASDFTASGGYISELAPDERVISVPLDSSHGLQGVVQVGDRVDVYADLEGAGGASGAVTELIATNIPVLAIDQVSGSGLGAGGAQSDVVLKVKAHEAGAFALASDHGKVWLVLRGSDAAEPGAQPTYDLQTLRAATGGPAR